MEDLLTMGCSGPKAELTLLSRYVEGNEGPQPYLNQENSEPVFFSYIFQLLDTIESGKIPRKWYKLGRCFA